MVKPRKEYARKWYATHKKEWAEYRRKYHEKNKEKENQRNREWQKNHPNYMSLWRQKHPEYLKEYLKEYTRLHPEKINNWSKVARTRLRETVLRHISDNIKCARCGLTDFRVLQIDHINGGGTQETRGTHQQLGQSVYYKKILEMPLEEARAKYQILCANCNWIKRIENKEDQFVNWKKSDFSILSVVEKECEVID